ncbi:MAG: hypothetical protein IJX39_07845 [Clostridia bacterium]|nr:hypothetical protein [Clostridia bacterium]
MSQYREEQAMRRKAWQVFKYYRAHEDLLCDRRHRALYDAAKAPVIDFLLQSPLHRDATAEELEAAMCFLADAENQEN